MKLGYSLKHCANIGRCQAIVDGDETSRKYYSYFLDLYNAEYYSRISARAQNTMHIDKFNKPLLLPLAEDVAKLHKHLKEVDNIMSSPDPQYQELAEAVLGQIIFLIEGALGKLSK